MNRRRRTELLMPPFPAPTAPRVAIGQATVSVPPPGSTTLLQILPNALALELLPGPRSSEPPISPSRNSSSRWILVWNRNRPLRTRLLPHPFYPGRKALDSQRTLGVERPNVTGGLSVRKSTARAKFPSAKPSSSGKTMVVPNAAGRTRIRGRCSILSLALQTYIHPFSPNNPVWLRFITNRASSGIA